MRKHKILSWILSATVMSCVAPHFLGATQLAAQTPDQLAMFQNGGIRPQQKPSFTQKIASVFTGNRANQPAARPAPAPVNHALDPISLGFESGPPNADLYLSMARLSDQGGNTSHARSMYQRALTVQPDHLEGMLALARLEDREGQLDAAMHYYLQAVHMHPQSPKALNDLSLCFARRGQLREAVAPIEQAIRLQPSKQLYRNNIAKILIELNQINGAVQHLSAAHPPAVAQYNMGILLQQRGRSQEAVQFLTAAVQIDPSLEPANTLLAQLTGGTSRFAQTAPAGNDHILPTPTGNAYPTTGSLTASPSYQTVPAETAQAPVTHMPMMLPAVR